MRLPLLLLAVLLPACATDPLDRPGTWRATRANEANLRAMIADPRDLAQGRDAGTSRGQAASVAIERLETGRRFPLPASTLSRVAPSGQEPQGGSPANTPAAPLGNAR